MPPETYSLCVRAQRLAFFYPGQDKPAVRDLSLQIAPGETVAIIGPNGCGKSTLAKLISGLLIPSSGRLDVLGQDLSDPAGRAAILGRVGIVFQSPDEQMVATTVERELAFGPENLGIPPDQIRARVDDLLERFDLLPYARRSPHLLSGGEKQRLALASVLAMQPELLIMDEVTSLLDPAGRHQVRGLIQNLRGQCTLILITQFPRETLIADRLILMHDGRIVKDAPPSEIFTDVDIPDLYGVDVPLVFRLLKAAGCAPNPPKK